MKQVTIQPAPEQHRIQIRLGERLLTEYRYGPDFADKPVFYPVLTRRGNPVNRGFPMETDRPGESHDHPHQQSLFFAYGDVNGVDFWSSRNGRIVHRQTVASQNGPAGELAVELDWLDEHGQVLLQETRRVTFGGTESTAWIDHDSVLTAPSGAVLGDTKEGMFALRVAAPLREKGGSGTYRDAFGRETEAQIWGKRAPWVALHGNLEGDPITLAIFDHPSTENHPSYWHARGYGLFSANPLGRKDFVDGAQPLNLELGAGESFRFRYRLMIYEFHPEQQRLHADYAEYIQ